MNLKSIILYRLFFLILCGTGICLSIIDKSMDGFMGNGTALNFFTLQSNIWVFILEIFLLIFSIIKLISHKDFIGEKVLMLKYMATVAISLTFIVYWCLLAPYLGFSYIISPSNILVHTITPLFMMIDYIAFDKNICLKKNGIFLSVIPPLYYFAFALIRAEVSDTLLTGGSRYPYWFIDLDLFGWFGNVNGLGVIYWVFLILIFVLGLR